MMNQNPVTPGDIPGTVSLRPHEGLIAERVRDLRQSQPLAAFLPDSLAPFIPAAENQIATGAGYCEHHADKKQSPGRWRRGGASFSHKPEKVAEYRCAKKDVPHRAEDQSQRHRNQGGEQPDNHGDRGEEEIFRSPDHPGTPG